jgi:hypothetical protein
LGSAWSGQHPYLFVLIYWGYFFTWVLLLCSVLYLAYVFLKRAAPAAQIQPSPQAIKESEPILSDGALFSPTITAMEPRRALELSALIPILESRYISREQPPAGRSLPDNWLKDEVSHLDMELRMRRNDERQIKNLKLPYSKHRHVIESPQKLSEYLNSIRGLRSLTELEFDQVLKRLQDFSLTWIGFRASPKSQIQLPGSPATVLLTPEIFASIQDQAMAALNRLRLHIVALELVLSQVVLEENRR